MKVDDKILCGQFIKRLDELKHADLILIRNEVEKRIAAQSEISITKEIEKNGFCVTDHSTKSSYASVTTYLNVTHSAERNVHLSECGMERIIPWARTSRHTSDQTFNVTGTDRDLDFTAIAIQMACRFAFASISKVTKRCREKAGVGWFCSKDMIDFTTQR